ncbi:EamA family transporter [Paenibacillus aceris]|uniref:Drug/metabolite transporter (DMT)-like permease n=1 Tax=Paenibacillus aceris TaxID=869555 RepID=A0ABS4HRS2_9BACL|nr:EamA family transporter [Paenibacillus aceris]MBP1961315.1 drug/metabolite transporter (DMT)-like permease [Paenibacillus aceris]NHW37897.1 EamA family transporter [Paenibacillus aceris]
MMLLQAPLFVVFLNVILLVCGQIVWKIALNRMPLTGIHNLGAVLLQPYILAGCLLYAAATLIWFYALSKFDLSRVYPLQSIAYVFGALFGWLVFKETFSSSQWIGLLFLVGGAFLLAK